MDVLSDICPQIDLKGGWGHHKIQAKAFMFVLHILHAKIVPCPFLTEVCFNKEDDHEETLQNNIHIFMHDLCNN